MKKKIKKIRAISNSSRNTNLINYRVNLSPTKERKKFLLEKNKKNSGRNNSGSITVRHRGGNNKRKYRVIDFKRNKNDNIFGTVKSIEYDPFRNARISLISYKNGCFSYILTPKGLKVGDKVISGDGDTVPIPTSTGNNLPLNKMPLNTFVHNIEMTPGKGGQISRSAGSYAEIVGKEENDKYVKLKLKSKEVRMILGKCRATVGKVGNEEINLVRLGKAGRNRWRGIRPTVRGVAMNPCDHPHGGGNDKVGIGRVCPVDPWGNRMGKKTRKKNKLTNKYIISSRSQNKKKY